MKISQYITALQALMDLHGDLDMEVLTADCNRNSVKEPHVAFRKILKGRESKPSFWRSWDALDRKGDKVVEV